MFTLFNGKANAEELDKLIDRVIADMELYGPDSDEYQTLITNLERLTKLKEGKRPQRVSRDTMWLVGGNLAGILVIVSYEHAHVAVSKAFSLLLKTRG